MVRITAEKQFVELVLLFGVEMPQQPQTELCPAASRVFQLAPLPALTSGMGKCAAALCFSPFSLHLEGHQWLSHFPRRAQLWRGCSWILPSPTLLVDAGSQAALGAAAHTQELVFGQQGWAPFPALWALG